MRLALCLIAYLYATYVFARTAAKMGYADRAVLFGLLWPVLLAVSLVLWPWDKIQAHFSRIEYEAFAKRRQS